MSVTLLYKSQAKVTEILDRNADSMNTAGSTVVHDQFDETATLTGATTPPVTQCAFFTQALNAGAATIDLTSVNGTDEGTLDLTGLKVQYFRMKNLGANDMVITFGAANPYLLAGAAFKITLAPGQFWEIFGNDATPDVAGGAKDMDLSGTTTQTCEITIVAG